MLFVIVGFIFYYIILQYKPIQVDETSFFFRQCDHLSIHLNKNISSQHRKKNIVHTTLLCELCFAY